MRLIILLQVFLYLVLPVFFYDFSKYIEMYVLVFCFLVSFLYASYVTINPKSALSFNFSKDRVDFGNQHKRPINIGFGRIVIVFLIVFIVIFYYAVLVFKYGLLDRRIGTEAIGLLYSRISILDLLYLRLVEIVYPIVFIYLFLFEKKYRVKNSLLFRFLNFSFLVAFFFFSAKWQSKSEIAFFLLVMLILSGGISSSGMLLHHFKRFFKFLLVVFVFFCGVSFYRYNNYSGSFNDVFYRDFIERLDGDKIIGQLIDSGVMKIYGSFDLSVYKYYISLFPFLDEAVYLKSIAMTSAKSYLLVNVLSLEQYDATSTLITDLAYFGGFWAVLMSGLILGYICKKVDRIILYNRYDNTFRFSLLVSLVFSFSRIEFEIIPQLFLFFKMFFLIYFMTYLFKKMGFK